jgi:hypothetical protein
MTPSPEMPSVRAGFTGRLFDLVVVGVGAPLLILVATCSSGAVAVGTDAGDTTTVLGGGAAPGDIVIPGPGDWTDQGEILREGDDGDWDRYLWGGFASSAVLREGVIYLYYQGSDGYDEAEGTVTFRAIGVATSVDGTTFRKRPGNPVISWRPNDDLEEGAASGGAFATPDGAVGLYYGANTHSFGEFVDADGRYAVSADGLNFQDRGVALDHGEIDLWGGGDEIFPIIGLEHEGRWITYYIPNGVFEKGRLGVAYGTEPLALDESSSVTAAGRDVLAWGPGGVVRLGPDRYALFVTMTEDGHVDGRHMDAYVMDPSDPGSLSELATTYRFADFSAGTILLDEPGERWYLIHRDLEARAYRTRTAPLERFKRP